MSPSLVSNCYQSTLETKFPVLELLLDKFKPYLIHSKCKIDIMDMFQVKVRGFPDDWI
jgi:hypothetical protein